METVAVLLAEGTARLRASGSESARLDAELLLGDAIGAGRTAIVAHPETPVGSDEVAAFRAAIGRRETGEPVAYIRGRKEFYGLAFRVDRRALIPRPETERLVELAIDSVMRRLATFVHEPHPPLRVVDVGTGSGAVAVALMVELRRLGAADAVAIVATDSSRDALDLARENAVRHAVADRIRFVEADLVPGTAGPGGEGGGGVYDVAVANLPYVRHEAIAHLPVATSFEPAAALDGGVDGLRVIERLLARLPGVLARDGEALLEIGSDQGEDIVRVVDGALPGWACAVEPDLAGLPRVARVQRT